MKGADATQVAKAVKGGTKLVKGAARKAKQTQRGLEVVEQNINRSREGLYTGGGKINTNQQKNVQNRVRNIRINKFKGRMGKSKN